MTDPWAAAASNQQAQNGQTAGQQAGQSVMPDQGGLGGGALFGGQGKRIPSLFNKGHQAGEVRGGIIVDIKDVHSHTHKNEGNLPRYWEDGNTGKGISPVTYPVSKITGKPNRPVMDVHIVLDTDYRLTTAECTLLERDPKDVETDDGKRAFVVSDTRQFQEGVQAFNQENPSTPIIGPKDLIGIRLDAKRMTPPMVKGQSYPVKLSKA